MALEEGRSVSSDRYTVSSYVSREIHILQMYMRLFTRGRYEEIRMRNESREEKDERKKERKENKKEEMTLF